jgi:hypothetical protein
MALPDLTGINIENSYQRVVHTDGVNYYNGTGSLLNLGPINTGSFATTGSNTFNGNQIISGSVRITNNAVITGSLIVVEANGNPRLDTSNGVLYRAGVASVDWRTRTLNNSADTIVLDWDNSQALDTLGFTSIDWENRVLWDLTGGAESIDYGRRKLYNSAGDVALDYNAGTFAGTASYATQALSASYAPNTPAFPFVGSAQITGSLSISGSLVVNNVDIQSTIVAMAIALG